MIELLQQWREDTPGCAHRTHLNNAGAGLMPRPVLDAVTGHLSREAQFGGYESADDAESAIQEVYAQVARLLGAQPQNIALVENSTVAFFQALSAFDFQPGDVIVTTRNDYISNQLAYLSLAQRRGVEIRRAADLPSGGVDPQSVRELLRKPRVCLLAVTWVPTNSGLVQPVEALGEIAESARIPYLVDGCQAVGEISVDVARLRCDFFSATRENFCAARAALACFMFPTAHCGAAIFLCISTCAGLGGFPPIASSQLPTRGDLRTGSSLTVWCWGWAQRYVTR